ncbi:hypothetical protein BSKO_04448 [Bryopsis sp. KO-2023]|nr:hypothetical protein BSKO_04448 [Bryopsis sp. KO-2023]
MLQTSADALVRVPLFLVPIFELRVAIACTTRSSMLDSQEPGAFQWSPATSLDLRDEGSASPIAKSQQPPSGAQQLPSTAKNDILQVPTSCVVQMCIGMGFPNSQEPAASQWSPAASLDGQKRHPPGFSPIARSQQSPSGAQQLPSTAKYYIHQGWASPIARSQQPPSGAQQLPSTAKNDILQGTASLLAMDQQPPSGAQQLSSTTKTTSSRVRRPLQPRAISLPVEPSNFPLPPKPIPPGKALL